MEAELLDRALEAGRQHRANRRPVRAPVLRRAPPGAEALDLVREAQASKQAGAVRGNRDPGTHLGEGMRLLVDARDDAALDQGVGERESADAAADDRNVEGSWSHSLLRGAPPMHPGLSAGVPPSAAAGSTGPGGARRPLTLDRDRRGPALRQPAGR